MFPVSRDTQNLVISYSDYRIMNMFGELNSVIRFKPVLCGTTTYLFSLDEGHEVNKRLKELRHSSILVTQTIFVDLFPTLR